MRADFKDWNIPENDKAERSHMAMAWDSRRTMAVDGEFVGTPEVQFRSKMQGDKCERLFEGVAV